MAEDSYPSASRDTGSGAGKMSDVEYEELAKLYSATGLADDPGQTYIITANGSGRVVHVTANKIALVRGARYNSGTTFDLTIAANGSGSVRYDLICLELDRSSDNEVRAVVVTGTPGAGVPPTPLTGDGPSGVYQFQLASVKVNPGASVINSGDVTKLGWWLGTPGVITSTGSVRPPHIKGRSIFEWETLGRLYSDGSAWKTGFEDSGWVSLTPATGWTAATTVAVRRINGVVFLRGTFFRSGASLVAGTDNTILSITNTSYQPSQDQSFLFYVAGQLGAGTVQADGNVRIQVYNTAINANTLIPHPSTYPGK